MKKAYLQLHISVFLWGFTAILGKLITLHEIPLVWYRVLLTCLALLLLPGVFKGIRGTLRQDAFKLIGNGCIIALHWICFYASIKYSNASIALSCLATTSFFTSLIEPVVFGQRIKYYEPALGLIVILGVWLIFYFNQFYQTGIIMGLAAAFLGGTFTAINKKLVERHEPRSMTFIELSGGLLFLSALLPFYHIIWGMPLPFPSMADWLYLIILSLVCTILPFIMALHALKHLTAFASTLVENLEPIYGIILAILFFNENEKMSPYFYLGTFIILLAVFIHPLLQKRFEKEVPLH